MRQRDMFAPSGYDRVAGDDESRGTTTLRDLVWRRIDGDQRELYAVAREVDVSSYWLTEWLRGEREADEQTAGRLYAAARQG